MKIGFFSDTHSRTDLVFDPHIDIFIHCGDILERGNYDDLQTTIRGWGTKLGPRKMYFTPGNHDGVFETDLKNRAINIMREENIIYLEDAGIIIEDISFWFMPWVPEISVAHSFNLNDEDRVKYIQKIPLTTDILITHGPPKYILDESFNKFNYGDDLLLEKIAQLKTSLKIHAFGHVHESRGVLKADDNSPLFINCAMGSLPSSNPIIVDTDNWKVIS